LWNNSFIGSRKHIAATDTLGVFIMSVISSKLVSAIISSRVRESKVADKAAQETDARIQMAVDQMCMACAVPRAEFLKGNAKTNPARREVKELFEEMAAAAGLGESAARNYATSFWIAFETGVPFMRTLYETKAKGPSAGRADDAAKAGSVKTTTMAEAIKTGRKLLEQLEVLNQLQARAALLDVLIELDPEFKV
jgi:hypothetical protein